MTLQEIKIALRNGPYAWPGGYPLYFLTSDGGTLAFDTVRAEWRAVVEAHLGDDRLGGWHIAAVDVNYEDSALYCDHSNLRIESAYAEDSAPHEEAATVDAPNLDCMPLADLLAYWRRNYASPNPTQRALARYADLKSGAMRWRLRGDIERACRIEAECDKLYNALPEDSRW